MTDSLHVAAVVAALVFWPTGLPLVLFASTVAYGVAKVRAEAYERANGWRRFVVGK